MDTSLLCENAPTTADVLKAKVSKAISITQPKITEKHSGSWCTGQHLNWINLENRSNLFGA